MWSTRIWKETTVIGMNSLIRTTVMYASCSSSGGWIAGYPSVIGIDIQSNASWMLNRWIPRQGHDLDPGFSSHIQSECELWSEETYI